MNFDIKFIQIKLNWHSALEKKGNFDPKYEFDARLGIVVVVTMLQQPRCNLTCQ